MDVQLLIRWGLVFAVFITTLSINIEDNLIAPVGVQESYLWILIVAITSLDLSCETQFVTDRDHRHAAPQRKYACGF